MYIHIWRQLEEAAHHLKKIKKKRKARHILGGLQDSLKDTALLLAFLRVKVLDLG